MTVSTVKRAKLYSGVCRLGILLVIVIGIISLRLLDVAVEMEGGWMGTKGSLAVGVVFLSYCIIRYLIACWIYFHSITILGKKPNE
jgi:hypothetical protein|tara:strand:- start:18535 stop:18792 length:258 start_codon:yes stop_codon:yes gene_type:complete